MGRLLLVSGRILNEHTVLACCAVIPSLKEQLQKQFRNTFLHFYITTAFNTLRFGHHNQYNLGKLTSLRVCRLPQYCFDTERPQSRLAHMSNHSPEQETMNYRYNIRCYVVIHFVYLFTYKITKCHTFMIN